MRHGRAAAREVEPPRSDRFTFYTTSDDGVRLWIEHGRRGRAAALVEPAGERRRHYAERTPTLTVTPAVGPVRRCRT